LAKLSTVASDSDSEMPIVIPLLNWSSQKVMASIIGGIFKHLRCKVKYVHEDPQKVYDSICMGNITISPEVWESSAAIPFNYARNKGCLLDWGNHKTTTREDIGFPNWVKDKGICPGLPDYKELKRPECIKYFVTPNSGGKGRILQGPWLKYQFTQRIKASGLDKYWKVDFARGANELWAEHAAAEKEGRNIIIFNWTPSSNSQNFTFIDFSPYGRGCPPSYGGYGRCGSPVGYLKKAVNKNFPKTHPKAAEAFRKISFTTTQIGAMAKLVDVYKMRYQDAANKWLADNRAVWQKWIK